jgi:uncharacterized membrane protein YoaK (UPF0700 family)
MPVIKTNAPQDSPPPIERRQAPVPGTGLRRDPLPAVLALLTVSTGLVDAISVLGLGHVFTANQTGNVVFAGLALAGSPGFSVPICVAGLGGFLAGAVMGGRLGTVLAGGSRRRWLLTAAGLEAGLFVVAALVATGYDPATLGPVERLYSLIVLTAVAMGIRNATVRRLAVPDVTTTVLTQALTGFAAESWLAGGSNLRWGRRLAAVGTIFVGAAAGAVLVNTVGLVLPLLLSGALVFLGILAYTAHPASRIAAGDAR